MLSGVGPAAHLMKHGIPVVHDLLGVGSHLVDHPVVDLYFKDKLDNSYKYFKPSSFSDGIKLLSAFVQYFVRGTGGPLATNVSTERLHLAVSRSLINHPFR
jgi:choline dehydrogenase